jgi:hypothetical protein
MADDVVRPSNLPVAPVKKEELEKAPFDEAPLDVTPLDVTPLDVNVFQLSHEEKPSKRVVRTQVNRSTWDRRLSPNPHALVIYLKFFPACGIPSERFEEC